MADKHWTLITGASEGLGRHFVRLAAKEKRHVILTARSEDKLAQAAEEARRHGVEAVVIPADLSEPGATDALWAKASEGRRIDILVNNAGLGRNGGFGDDAYGGWAREQAVMQVNMIALTELMYHAVRHMKEMGGGRILNVASTAAFMPGPNMAVYCATKSYVLSLTDAVAGELAETDVTVTALCPGATKTEFFTAADMGSSRIQKLAPLADAGPVAEAGWLAARSGKRMVVPGMFNKLSGLLPRVLPRPALTRLSGYILGRH